MTEFQIPALLSYKPGWFSRKLRENSQYICTYSVLIYGIGFFPRGLITAVFMGGEPVTPLIPNMRVLHFLIHKIYVRDVQKKFFCNPPWIWYIPLEKIVPLKRIFFTFELHFQVVNPIPILSYILLWANHLLPPVVLFGVNHYGALKCYLSPFQSIHVLLLVECNEVNQYFCEIL